MGVKVVFLSDYSLILCLLRHKNVTAFLNKKKRKSSLKNSLNNSIDYKNVINIIFLKVIQSKNK